MYKLHTSDIELYRSETLLVWLRRPTDNHRNWWVSYYSTDAEEAMAWDWAIRATFRQLEVMFFHQGIWSVDHHRWHPECHKVSPDRCPGVVQAWEIWIGCSDWALHFPDASLEDLRACGDPALETLLATIPTLQDKVAQW